MNDVFNPDVEIKDIWKANFELSTYDFYELLKSISKNVKEEIMLENTVFGGMNE